MSEQYRQLPIEELQEFIGEDSKTTEELHSKLETQLSRQGVEFDYIPDSVYPGMPYTTPSKLVESGAVLYTRQHINKFFRDNEILSDQIGGSRILNPAEVQAIVDHQEQSLDRANYPGRGRKPGAKGKKRES